MSRTEKPLTLNEHRTIALQLHAIDAHLATISRMLTADHGKLRCSRALFGQIETLRDTIGAASPSRNTKGSVLDQCQSLMMSEWPEATLEAYNGSRAACCTLPDEVSPSDFTRS